MRITVTRTGVMLDRLCFDILGTDAGGVVEATLVLNPGLAELLAGNGHELPLGHTLTLPDPEALRPADRTIKLWD